MIIPLRLSETLLAENKTVINTKHIAMQLSVDYAVLNLFRLSYCGLAKTEVLKIAHISKGGNYLRHHAHSKVLLNNGRNTLT